MTVTEEIYAQLILGLCGAGVHTIGQNYLKIH